MPESNLPSACAFSPDVAVCGCESSFVHVTVAANSILCGAVLAAIVDRVEFATISCIISAILSSTDAEEEGEGGDCCCTSSDSCSCAAAISTLKVKRMKAIALQAPIAFISHTNNNFDEDPLISPERIAAQKQDKIMDVLFS
jgi:hypothetical protein